MENNISIDELFSSKLTDGKEQLNLGAWANMERMLNGENPYLTHKENSKTKRRIFPFLALFMLLSSGLTAGYLWLQKNNNNEINTKSLSLKNTIVENKNNNKSHLVATTDNDIVLVAANNFKSNNSLEPSEIIAPTVKENEKKKNLSFSNTIEVENKKSNKQVVISEVANDNIASIEKPLQKNKEKTKIKKTKKELSALHHDINIEEESNIELVNKPAIPQKQISQKVVIKENEIKNRNGGVENIVIDTIEKIKNAIVKQEENEVNEINKKNIDDENYKYHPRYLGAQSENQEPAIALLQAQPNELKNVVSNPPPLKESNEINNKSAEINNKNLFKSIAAVSAIAAQKIAASGGNFLRLFKAFDPGMSVGVNAALFNTKNNYGGFHGGLTNHTALNEYYEILTELKMFFKNNAGFTINDIRTTVLNKIVDSISLAGQDKTIYKYDVDSVTKKYNFKNFISFELPILLNRKINNLSVYAGPNFVYNKKISIQVVEKAQPIAYLDTVSINQVFNYPVEKFMQYNRDDFGARFGIGYVAGVSYYFNPKIYIDMRVSKVVWDNTKLNTTRQISNGVSKVPFTQLSLGYRFLNKK